MVKRPFGELLELVGLDEEEENRRRSFKRHRHFFPSAPLSDSTPSPTASTDSSATMAPSTTVEYSSHAPDPLPSTSQTRYSRLSSHHLLPDGTPDYLRLILTAKVYDVVRETPLAFAHNLSARLGNQIYLKREDLQEVFSFKIRGAYNFMAGLTEDERWKGVVTCSAGALHS